LTTQESVTSSVALEVISVKTYLALLLGSVFLVAPGAALAQVPITRPTVSPYLNLLQGGQPPGVNYYGIVRPELDFRSSIQKLQQQNQTNQQALADLQNPTVLPATGHFTGFMTQGPYFQSFTGGPVGIAAGTAVGTGTPGVAASFGTVGTGGGGRGGFTAPARTPTGGR
jgi:hypothetical protein